ncbi:MAG: protein kinase [Armatimonadota bacterium]|nr:protein kinase [bacterium]MDW8321415.1 protein kinase [Armatimonadota bacterium]
MTPSVNTLGKYQIVREIARSNDIVWEAVDPELGRRVAIKELNLPEGVTEVQRQERIHRFLREAKAAGRLGHPNIVTIHEVDIDNGRHYIVMEYLEGENLRERLQRQGAIPLKEAVDITLQVLAALEHAHRMGVVHRDIKPENIHLLPDGLVKITDFGIARIVFEPNITIDGQIFGTPSYMSPEQIEGGEIDQRTDIFSLGVVLYEMLTGRKPFTGESIVTITYNIMHKEPTPPPGVPYGIERVLMRAMAKRPIDRYASAREMAEDLKRAMEPGALVMPAPPPVVAPPPQTASPSPASLPPLLNPVPNPAPVVSQSSALPQAQKKPPPPLPKPHEPWLSPRESEAMKQMILTLFLGLLIVLVAYGINIAYERYVEMQRMEALSTQMSDGVKLAQAGNHREALARFVNVYHNAKSAEVRTVAARNAAVCLVHLGDEALQTGRADLALQYYQQALEYDPTSAAARQRMDQLSRLYSGNLSAPPPIALPPASRLNGSASEPPPRPRGNEPLAMELYMRGLEAYQRGDRLTAVDLWQKAIQAAPGSETARLAMESIQQLTAR